MKLKLITIENFRCYKYCISVAFDDLTTFVGKNDIGKSTILDALEIFFNNDTVKIDNLIIKTPIFIVIARLFQSLVILRNYLHP